MKATFAALVILAGTTIVGADAYSTFNSVVRFSDTLKDVVSKPALINPNVLYLLEGTIRDIRVQRTDGGFYAEADYVDAEWEGLDDIITYKVILIFAKAQFAEMIPERPSRNDPTKISVNSRGLALVQLVRTIPGENGKQIPVFRVQDYRILR